jgi:hypothetical protein
VRRRTAENISAPAVAIAKRSLRTVIVDVSGDSYVDLDMEAMAAMKRD